MLQNNIYKNINTTIIQISKTTICPKSLIKKKIKQACIFSKKKLKTQSSTNWQKKIQILSFFLYIICKIGMNQV